MVPWFSPSHAHVSMHVLLLLSTLYMPQPLPLTFCLLFLFQLPQTHLQASFHNLFNNNSATNSQNTFFASHKYSDLKHLQLHGHINNPNSAMSSLRNHTNPRPTWPPARSTAALIRPANSIYPRSHLLSLPLEVRNMIWAIISSLTMDRSTQPRHTRGKDDFRALLLTCRQLYDEVQPYSYRYLFPWPRLHLFLETRFNRITIQSYKSLTFEVRLDAHPGYFTGLAAVLAKAQPYLQELRLFFIGTDQYGTRVHSHGCGSVVRDQAQLKLPIDGQRLVELLPLWKRIAALRGLEVLVISNANFQVFEPMLLVQKPYLRYLHLSTDPRSTAHMQHKLNELGFLLTGNVPERIYPPLRVLHIATNAILSPNAIAAKCAATLEHLTWVVPYPANQSGALGPRSLERTVSLVRALQLKAKRLQTFRLCLGGWIYENAAYGTLLGDFKALLPYLRCLQHLEIHAKSRSHWFGKEIIARLPDSLENLYLTDYTIHPIDLLHQVWERYLTTTESDQHDRGILDVTYINTVSDLIGYSSQDDAAPNNLPLAYDDGPWLMSNDHHTNYDITAGMGHTQDLILRHKSQMDRIIQPGYCHSIKYISQYRQDYMDLRATGDSTNRHDYIPFDTGCLRFVHFEYTAHNSDNVNHKLPSALFIALLINGRLLDKERNRHLAKYAPGQFIPPNHLQQANFTASDTETAMRSEHFSYATLLHKLYEVETTHPRQSDHYHGEFQQSSLADKYDGYFGYEDEAFDVFESEHVAKAEHLPLYRYPVEKDIPMDGKCHWMSPEAIV